MHPRPAPARALAPRPPADVLHSLRGDIARLASQLDTLRPGAGGSAEVAGLHGEIERLQTMVAGLATRDEVNALERALRGITAQVANARAPGDLAAVSRPVEELEAEIGRVAELVTSGVHGRLSREFETLARRIEAISGSGIDPEVIDGLAQQLLDVRRLLSDMAEPQRVQQLAAQFAELNERLTEIGRRQLDAREFERRFDGLARKLDSLGGDVPSHASGDIAGRIDALSQKLDRLSEKPRITVGGPPAEGLDSLVQRLDRLDEALTRGGPAPQLKPIEDMLRTLVARIDQAERPGAGANSLDALEKQVAILARRLERGSGDPALSALERTMGDLMAQVELMRTGAYEAAERAAKAAVADTLATLPKPEPEPQIGLLRRDLDDLRSSRNGADERVQSTLESVHAALEKVVARLGSLDGEPTHAEPLSPHPGRAVASAADQGSGADAAQRRIRPCGEPRRSAGGGSERSRSADPAGEPRGDPARAGRGTPASRHDRRQPRREPRRQGELHRRGAPRRPGRGRGGCCERQGQGPAGPGKDRWRRGWRARRTVSRRA